MIRLRGIFNEDPRSSPGVYNVPIDRSVRILTSGRACILVREINFLFEATRKGEGKRKRKKEEFVFIEDILIAFRGYRDETTNKTKNRKYCRRRIR